MSDKMTSDRVIKYGVRRGKFGEKFGGDMICPWAGCIFVYD